MFCPLSDFNDPTPLDEIPKRMLFFNNSFKMFPDGVESIPLDNAILTQGKNSYMLGDMSTGLWYQSDYKNIKKAA